MNVAALQLCSRLAYKPNALGYCGRDSAQKIFYSCIVDKKCARVKEEIERFIVLNPYLKTIAQVTGEDIFSYKVIEAYWFGNDMLKKITPDHYDVLLHNLALQGVPKILIDEIKNKRPPQFVPIHLFNILHVGVGKASHAVPFNLNSINNCMVRWGAIKGINNRSVLVSAHQLDAQYVLVEKSVRQLYDPALVGELAVGDVVAIHWGSVAKKISFQEEKQLSQWTQTLLNTLRK